MKRIKKIMMTILASFAICSSAMAFGCASDNIVKAPEPAQRSVDTISGDYGNVVLSFISVSDLHFSSVYDSYAKEYYEKALNSVLIETHNNLGAVVVGGDFSEGYLKDYDTLIGRTAAVVGYETPLIAAYGNHEGDGKHHQYIAKFGKPVDNVNTVNGYNFVVVGAHAKNSYTEEQAEWLDEQLSEMTTAEPDKPVFVVVHHPVYDTHNPDDGNPELRETLEKYKQAFVISSHDHAPFSDASFWQGKFTSFRNSCFQDPDEGQYALIRVTDKNYVVIKKYAIRHGQQVRYLEGQDIVVNLNEFYAAE